MKARCDELYASSSSFLIYLDRMYFSHSEIGFLLLLHLEHAYSVNVSSLQFYVNKSAEGVPTAMTEVTKMLLINSVIILIFFFHDSVRCKISDIRFADCIQQLHHRS